MAPKLRDLFKLIEDNGWVPVVTQSRLRQWRHSAIRGRITVAAKPDDDLDAEVRKSILSQAHLPMDAL